MNRIKNLHFLYMFPQIETLFKDTIEKVEEEEVAEAFIKLRMCIEALEQELIKANAEINEWYKGRISMKDRPTSDEIIKRLKTGKIITEKQSDLFNSIKWIANKYVHLDRDSSKEKQDLESIKIFCTRLDNELPSITAHLGIGGSSRKEYIDEDNKIKDSSYKTSSSSNSSSASSSYYSSNAKNAYTESKTSSSAYRSTNYGRTSTYTRSKTYQTNSNIQVTTTPEKASLKQKIRMAYNSIPLFCIRLICIFGISAFVFVPYFKKYHFNLFKSSLDKYNSINVKYGNAQYDEGEQLAMHIYDSFDKINMSSIIPNKKLDMLSSYKKCISFQGLNGDAVLQFADQYNEPLSYSGANVEINISNGNINIKKINILNRSISNSYNYAINISKRSGISNGDDIIASIPQEAVNMLESLNISIDPSTIEISVDGLLDEQFINDSKEELLDKTKQLVDSVMRSKSENSWKYTATIKKAYYIPSSSVSKPDAILVYFVMECDRYPNFFGDYRYTYDLGRLMFSAKYANNSFQLTNDYDDYDDNYYWMLHGLSNWVWEWDGNQSTVNHYIKENLPEIENSTNAIVIK